MVNRQINYTNVCVNGCTFCAFRRDEDSEPGAFRLSKEDILERLRAARQGFPAPGRAATSWAGCHPELRLGWFEDVLRTVREIYPDLPLKAFTPVEIEHFARLEGISSLEVLPAPQGRRSGHDARRRRGNFRRGTAPANLPAQGRRPGLGCAFPARRTAWASRPTAPCFTAIWKITPSAWTISAVCASSQDKSGGFTCFIPLPFLTENSRLKLPEDGWGPSAGWTSCAPWPCPG